MLTQNKINHNIEVARLCYQLAKEKYGCSERFARSMWTIGYNHDIGYEFLQQGIDSPKIHPEISDEMIFSAFGGDSYAIKYHGKKVPQEDLALRILNESDLQVDPKGKRVSVDERLSDIKKRYGADSSQYGQAKWLAIELELVDKDYDRSDFDEYTYC